MCVFLGGIEVSNLVCLLLTPAWILAGYGLASFIEDMREIQLLRKRIRDLEKVK